MDRDAWHFSGIPLHSESSKLDVEVYGKKEIIQEYKGLIHMKYKRIICHTDEINIVYGYLIWPYFFDILLLKD